MENEELIKQVTEKEVGGQAVLGRQQWAPTLGSQNDMATIRL